MNDTEQFVEGYAAALEAYFKTGEEMALSLAYKLGRAALGDGLGVLDMVGAHQQVVEERVLSAPATERPRWARRAADFLREVLSPFEMTFRGYRDANQQLRRLNEELAHQKEAVEAVNRDLESFSYSVSHDLRAPLRSITGFSRALMEDCGETLDQDGKRYLHHVQQAAEEMERLIDDILKLARVVRVDLSRGEVDLSAIARQICARLQATDPTRRVDFVVQDQVLVVGDDRLLGVLLENLLGNAWKFTGKRDQARIEFGSRPHDAQLAYFVRDNGAGFAPAYSSKLFGTFQRLHAASEFEGTGIGLATVMRVARRHGGRAWAEGEVDRGATFYFTLALPKAAHETGRGSRHRSPPFHSRRIRRRHGAQAGARGRQGSGPAAAGDRGPGDSGVGAGAQHLGPRRQRRGDHRGRSGRRPIGSRHRRARPRARDPRSGSGHGGWILDGPGPWARPARRTPAGGPLRHRFETGPRHDGHLGDVDPMSKPLRALVVEDTDRDFELLMRELRKGGYEVTHQRVQTAAAMRAALADPNGWDVVLSDYTLPDFDAPRALATLEESGLDIPFIIISGTIGEEIAVSALQAGASDFLAKGKMARLIPAIERELRECHVRAARRRAEAALRESEARYRRIIETTNEGLWMIDGENRITFANRRMGALLGCAPGELLGRTAFDFVLPESRPALARSLESPRLGQPAGQIEVRLLGEGGAAPWVLLDSTPLLEDDDRDAGILVMVMDISQRRLLEEQLRQAQKIEAIGSLAGGIAHDFNNLLSVILSYTSLVIDGLTPGDPIRADLEEVAKAGDRARELTRQLMAFSRKQLIEPRALDLNPLLLGMERMLHRLLGESFELSLRTEQVLGTVYTDRSQMEQIVMNLVVNARDAMPNGGRVTIETRNVDLDEGYASAPHEVTPGPYVLLAVTDTGVGMDVATQARIFEPFFTTKEPGKGTGLGLSTVFGIVKQSGGHVWVDSEPGKGTTFKIYLPRTDGPAAPVGPAPPAPVTLRGTETVLLVEDEEQVRIAARVILRRQGYDVLEAHNGGEGFLICERHQGKIHLLVTDVVMPHMSGKELAERLAAMRPEMKVLFLSGYTENAIVHHGVLGSGVAFLAKPITPDALARKVRTILDAASGNHAEASSG